MANNPSENLLRLKGLFALLSASVAVLSPTLIKARLIPDQIDFLGTLGMLFILASTLAALVFWEKLNKPLVWFVIGSCLALIMLTFIQSQYVVEPNLGHPPEERHLLIGYQLTQKGNEDWQALEATNATEFVALGGYTDIPLWYGRSYAITKLAYVFSYMGFAIGVVLTLGGIVRRSSLPPRRVRRSRGRAQGAVGREMNSAGRS